MTIKHLGGVFGRNPTFNDVTIEGQLTFEGNLDIDSDITWEDNKKAIFGDSGDLQIFHDSSNGTSVITESGGGDLLIKGSNLRLQTPTGENYFVAINNGASNVFYDGLVKLATSSSGVTVTGNVAVNAGSGIDFSATSGTGTSELFDDYEEGEFAVTVTPGTSGSVTLNSSFDTGAYTKVGNLVTVTGFVVVSSVSSPAGFFKINLPITPAASTDRAADAAASVTMQNVVSANCADFLASVNENDPNLYIQLGDGSTLQNDSAQQLQANTYIIFSATYRGA